MSPDAGIEWSDEARRAAFERWLGDIAARQGIEPGSIEPAGIDSGPCRHLRVRASGSASGSFVIMDAPHPGVPVGTFVAVARQAEAAALNCPRVLECDEAQGFLLLTDLGQASYLEALNDAPVSEVGRLMRAALEALVRWQVGVPAGLLPPHDQAHIERELALFPEWCARREFGIEWNAGQQASWGRIVMLLAGNALAQPVVAAHADYTLRNLVPCAPLPGITGFHAAMAGAISYDLAALLRDAIVPWDESQEIDWAVRYWDAARRASLPVPADFGEFWRALEWMGLQRHLHKMGWFCRLKHEGGRPNAAVDLPRLFDHATKVALRYGPLKPLLPLLEPMSRREVSAGFTF